MSKEEKWRLVFRKHPEARYNRANAYWKFGEEFYGFKIYATKNQLMSFFKDFAGIERSVREILKEEEFKPEQEADAKRYEKMSSFQRFKSNLNKKDNDQFERVFGKDDEEQIEKMGKSGIFG